jgi:hypothetical protein
MMDHGQKSVDQIVIVISRRIPGEIHPGPPDGKERHDEGDDPLDGMGFRNGVMEP